MSVCRSPSPPGSIDSLSFPQLAAQLDNQRQIALALRCVAHNATLRQVELGQPLKATWLDRDICRIEESIARFEHGWIDRLIRLEQCGLHYFGTPQTELESAASPPRCLVKSSSRTPERLPPEIWAVIIEFLNFDPETLGSLAEVDQATEQAVTSAFGLHCQAVLSDPLMQPFVDQDRPTDLEDQVTALELAASRLQEPSFLLTAQGWAWTDKARASTRSTLLRQCGANMVREAAAQVLGPECLVAPEWWSDRLFALECAKRDVRALDLVSDELRENRSFVKEVCRWVPRALSHLPRQWRGDREVMEQAIHQPGPDILSHPLLVASDELKDDESLAKRAISVSWAAFCWVSNRLQDNQDLALQAIALSHHAYGYASHRLQSDPVVCLAAIQKEPMAFWLIPNALMSHPLVQGKRPPYRPGQSPAQSSAHPGP